MMATLPVIPAPRAARCPLAPPAEFATWRDSEGLQRASWQGKEVWMISRYEDIKAALVDPRLSANTMMYVIDAGADQNVPLIFPRLDDPEHNRIRRMMTRDFTFRRAESMRPQIQELVDGFLDDMIAAGPPADLVSAFALPVPSTVISLLLGVPYEDHEFFQNGSNSALDSRRSEADRMQTQLEMFAYMTELVDRKAREPGDDLLSKLVTDYVATGQLNRETAAATAMIMLAAGHETTANMLALGMIALLDHPDEYARLGGDDPVAVSNIVEELMRYLTIVHSLIDRVATEDLTIGGQLIRAGETVLMNLPAGNFDPIFIERPDDFDPGRTPKGHLGFGFGVHQCLGANLARVEMHVAFATLARRLPGLALAVPADQLIFQNNKEIYGVTELPVTW
jgi:cytochrome P450